MRSTGRLRDRAVIDAMFLGVAIMLSYLEAILPIGAVIPVPGIKLGLANVAVMITFFRCGAIDAASVSLLRVLICGLLFGSPISTALAAGGAVAAFAGLIVYKFLLSKLLSPVGASILSAALHALGQLAVAAVITSGASVFAYAPVMLVASVVTGALNGVICMLVLNRLTKETKRNYA